MTCLRLPKAASRLWAVLVLVWTTSTSLLQPRYADSFVHVCVSTCFFTPSQFGCLVVNAPTANTVAAAEHGIALMCAMSRYVPQADKSMKAGKWERTKYVGVSLVGKTLAIMGFGKV